MTANDRRAKILEAIGPREPLSSLDLEFGKRTDCGSYSRTKIFYNVADGERISAYLLVPSDLKELCPAVVAVHQHAACFETGKGEPCGLSGLPDFRYASDLAERGYTVVVPDLLCFEERRYGEYFNSEYDRSNRFEKIAAQYLLAEGRTLTGKYLYDLVTAVDVLCRLPFVDKNRIGVVGHSTGGQCALWLAWYDERIRACICSCGAALASDLRDHGAGHNLAMVFPDMEQICDYDDLAAGIAPRGLVYTCGNYDPTFLMYSCRKLAERTAEVYRKQNAAENFLPVFFEGWHWLKQDVKDKIYPFFDRQMGVKR